MKLIRLKLENFRQYREAQLDFRDGMTAIVGPNGSGKSTVLEAITFALFGAQRQKSKRDDLKFYWAEPRSKLRVVLTFEFDARTFVLERSEKDASLMEGATTKATGLSEVKAACERLLHLNYEQFKNSFCAEQKGLAFLHFQTDTRKQEQVAKMLGFDRLRTAATLAKDRGREFRVQAGALQAVIGNAEEIKAQLAAATAEAKAAEARIGECAKKATAIEEQLGPAAELRVKAEEFGRLSGDIEVLTERSSLLKKNREAAALEREQAAKQVDRLQALAPQAAKYESLEKDLAAFAEAEKADLARRKDEDTLAALRAHALALSKQIDARRLPDLTSLQAAVRAAISAHEGAESRCREIHGEWVKSIADAEAALKAARDAVVRTKREFSKASELAKKGICPECGQPTGQTFETKLASLQAEVASAETALVKGESDAKSAQRKPAKLELAEEAVAKAKLAHGEAQSAHEAGLKAHGDARGEQELHRQALSEIERLEKQLFSTPSAYDKAAHEKAKALSIELKSAYLEWVRLKHARDALKEADAKLKSAEEAFEVAHARFKELSAARKALPLQTAAEASEAIERHNRLSAELKVAQAELRAATDAKTAANTRLGEAERRLEEHRKSAELLRNAHEQAAIHEIAAREMANLREELNAAIVPDLESRACETLAQLTNGRYPILTLDDEFNATVLDEEVKKNVISGGEEDVVALALRIALSELIQERQGRPMSLMILDEVFGSLDADRRQAVLERLQAIKGRFSQILVISHIEEINQVADQCIFLRRDEKSRATVVGDAPAEHGVLLPL